MTRPIPLVRALPLILAIGLAGCVSVFPKQPPAQMYRFGVAAPSDAEAPPAAGGARFEVMRAPTTFDQAAAGDRILTFERDRGRLHRRGAVAVAGRGDVRRGGRGGL